MKSHVIQVSNQDADIQNAFEEANRAADLAGLDQKQRQHLRLLTEETMSLLRSVAGELHASFWLVWEDKAFELHLSANQRLGNVQRSQLINSTTSKSNEAAKTFLGKLRDMFEQALSVQTDVSNYYSAFGASTSTDISDEIIASEKWDEYERSILLTVADKVAIGIKGGVVDMVISKKFA